MATTPVYGFVTPDLANTADGPTALATLATRVEREMSTLRATNTWTQEPNAGYNQNTSGNVIHSITASPSVIGWLDIEASINLAAIGGSSSDVSAGAFAGFMQLQVDAVQIRNYRFHSLWSTRSVVLTFSGKVTNTAVQTSRVVRLVMDLQTGLGVSVNHSEITVAQFGAPGTG